MATKIVEQTEENTRTFIAAVFVDKRERYRKGGDPKAQPKTGQADVEFPCEAEIKNDDGVVYVFEGYLRNMSTGGITAQYLDKKSFKAERSEKKKTKSKGA